MQVCKDESAFEWIRNGRRSVKGRYDDSDWQGVVVANLLPCKFDSYIKILHRIDANYENIDSPLSPEELVILGIPPCDVLKLFVQQRRSARPDTRIRWREMADHLNVQFRPEIVQEWFVKALSSNARCWPRFIYGPNDGTLDKTEKKELVLKLLPFTHGNCFFRWAEISRSGTDEPVLFEGDLEAAAAEWNPNEYPSVPEYWWSESRNWCVCCDYDLDFTFVGCTRDLAGGLLKSEVLECIAVTPETRVDVYTPMPTAS
jgi:hypothetical protein